MKTITVYELLGMVKDGKELPKKVKYAGVIFENKNGDLLNDINYSLFEHRANECEKLLPMLNDEVEILEEEPRDIEVCGSLFTKSEYDKLAHSEEEKKIPEKLENEKEFYAYTRYEENKNEIDKVLYILKAINLTEEKIDNLNNSINSIIDYLKSKGDE